METSLFIAGFIFILVILLGFLIFHYSVENRKIKAIRERVWKEAAHENNEQNNVYRKYKHLLLGKIGKLGKIASPEKEADLSQTKKRLLRAGYHAESNLKVFFGAKVFMALLLPALFALLKVIVLKTLPAQHFITIMLLFVAAGFYIPDLYLYRKTQARKRKIFEGFPDALDLMVVCVEAGMGLDAAIKRVGDEMSLKNVPLSEEFKTLSLELRAGKPRIEALRNLATRTDLEDVSTLVTLLIQTDRFGTTVAKALRVHSDSMRTKRYQRAEEMAAKIPVKIVMPLILFIFPALFVTIVGPAVIKIYRVLILRGS